MTEAERYAAKCEEVRAAEAILEQLKAEKAALEKEVLDCFQVIGCPTIRTDSHTVYLQRTLIASPAGPIKAVCQALESEGFGKHVQPTIIHASELGKSLEALPVIPRRLQHAIRLVELFHARVRRK